MFTCLRDNAGSDPLFRLHSTRWALGCFDLGTSVPVKDRHFRILRFEYDVSEFRGAATFADLPTAAGSHPSYVAVFTHVENRNSLIVDEMTARSRTGGW